MMKQIAVISGMLVLAGSFAPVSAYVMDEVPLDKGHTEHNQILSPVLDAEGLGVVTVGEIHSAYDSDGYLVRMMTKSLITPKPKYKKPRYRLSPSIDLGALFAEALRSEAAAMGLPSSPESANQDGWNVSGTLHDIALEIRPSGGGFGPLLFYGYMDLELIVEAAAGGRESERLRLYGLSHQYNAGWGVQDEAREALARFLVESAQEVVARLNRTVFRAPAHPRIGSALESLTANGKNMENDLRSIGLSATHEAVPKLLDLLVQEKGEGDRVEIINALANIGSDAAFEVLSGRYDKEDKDARVFTLKAMDYIGTDETAEFIKRAGTDDGHLPCRVLAYRAVQP